jgi:glycosyltransferase involved in cell wall biosynthesis
MQTINRTTKPFFSIIINCYNGEEYLADALQSVLDQTFIDWEIIFWDNCSTDGSRAIVESYSDKRIRYCLAPDHTNLGRARVLAIAQAKGNWIGFLDVDDFCYPRKLQLQFDSIKKSKKNVGLIYGRCEILIEQERDILRSARREVRPCKRLPEGDISKEILDGNFLPSPSVLYRAEALKESAFASRFEHAPDYYFSTVISQKYSAKAVDEIICVYRKHARNLSLEKEEAGHLEGLFIANLADPGQLIANAHIARCVIYFVRKKKLQKAFCIVKDNGLWKSITSGIRLINFRRIY